jgi:hypothetical protein
MMNRHQAPQALSFPSPRTCGGEGGRPQVGRVGGAPYTAVYKAPHPGLHFSDAAHRFARPTLPTQRSFAALGGRDSASAALNMNTSHTRPRS